MATIIVHDCKGKKELQCFDTLLDVPYLVEEEEDTDLSETIANPFA